MIQACVFNSNYIGKEPGGHSNVLISHLVKLPTSEERAGHGCLNSHCSLFTTHLWSTTITLQWMCRCSLLASTMWFLFAYCDHSQAMCSPSYKKQMWCQLSAAMNGIGLLYWRLVTFATTHVAHEYLQCVAQHLRQPQMFCSITNATMPKDCVLLSILVFSGIYSGLGMEVLMRAENWAGSIGEGGC